MATRESARLICASNGGNLGFSSSSIIMPIRNISASCPRTLFGGGAFRSRKKKELEVENEKINTERSTRENRGTPGRHPPFPATLR